MLHHVVYVNVVIFYIFLEIDVCFLKVSISSLVPILGEISST